jgi:phosphate-selective porin OprO/OprP
MRSSLIGLLALTILIGMPAAARAQAGPNQANTAQANGRDPQSRPIEETIDAGEAEIPTRSSLPWNSFDARFTTVRIGFGYLWDYAAFDQDEVSKQQVDVEDQWKLRDARVLIKGKLPFARQTTWSMGIMYDKAKGEWAFRQTGVMVSVPEIWGDIFVGRTKEGFSLNKVMVGYGGWTNERAPINDATLPILADGIKWLGYLPDRRLLWNVGFYGDAASEGQSFSTYENQLSGRIAWLPILSTDGGTLFHLGFSGRLGKANSDKLQLRARPGAWAAPYFVDTGEFAAESTTMTGVEVYYRPGSFTFGSELFFQKVDAPDSGNPFFHGGEVFASWLITGEVRQYNTRGGYFNQISPSRSIYGGGPGAWEVVAHATYIDLDDKAVTGGKYWRFTPMVNWYLSNHARLEFVYGYGSLNRFNVIGKTHFFQTRIQLQLD